MRDGPPILTGCTVLPPMDDDQPQADKPKRKTTKAKAADRFAVMNAFVDVSLAKLCRGDIAVWWILFRDERDGISRTAQTDIAARAGMSLRGVKVAIRRLQRLGYLKQVFRGGINRGPSRYRVLPLAHWGTD